MLVRLHRWQMEGMAAGLGLDAVSRVEAYLRANYGEQCAEYEDAALRDWIEHVLADVTASGFSSTEDLFLRISVRWVMRASFGEPDAPKGMAR
jgi:hypothetical protein